MPGTKNCKSASLAAESAERVKLMILNWSSGEFTNKEKLIGTLFDAGIIRRSDLMFLLCWRRSKTDSHLLSLRQQQMLQTSRDSHGNTVYMLDENGVRAAHQLCHLEAKIVKMQAQVSHQIGIIDILMRFIKVHGREGVRWYSTREASDELFNFRKIVGNTDAEIRSSYIRPDALISVPRKGIYFLEYDNATESSKQIRRKYTLYIQNLSIIDEYTEGLMRRVMWVTPTVNRARWLEAKWNEIKNKRNIEMLFYMAGQETSVLAGTEEMQTV